MSARNHIAWNQEPSYLNVVEVDCVADSEVIITATYNGHRIKLCLPEYCKFTTNDLMRMVYHGDFTECD